MHQLQRTRTRLSGRVYQLRLLLRDKLIRTPSTWLDQCRLQALPTTQVHQQMDMHWLKIPILPFLQASSRRMMRVRIRPRVVSTRTQVQFSSAEPPMDLTEILVTCHHHRMHQDRSGCLSTSPEAHRQA